MSYILVGGVARSGTTLLYGVLCSGQQTNPALFETHLVPLLLELYHKTRWRSGNVDDGQFFADVGALQGYFRKTLIDFLEPLRDRYGSPPHLVLKSIKLTEFCPEALDLLADCKVVVSVRDPRDIVASQLDVAIKEGRVAAGAHKESDIEVLASEIVQAYKRCFKVSPAGRERFHVVRYEDLVSSPRETVDRLAAWTGLDLSGFDSANAWAHSLRDFAADRAAGSAYVTELFGAGISDSRIGQYGRVLTPADVRAIEAVCRPFMAAFGYGPSKAPT